MDAVIRFKNRDNTEPGKRIKNRKGQSLKVETRSFCLSAINKIKEQELQNQTKTQEKQAYSSILKFKRDLM